MLIWIDTMSGTYGPVDDLALVDMPVEGVDELEFMSDAEISEVGLEAGVVPLDEAEKIAGRYGW